MFEFFDVEKPDELWKTVADCADDPLKRVKLLGKTSFFAAIFDRNSVKSALRDRGLLITGNVDEAVDCGKPGQIEEKPCVSTQNLWKTLWILWKNMGKNVWNVCVNQFILGIDCVRNAKCEEKRLLIAKNVLRAIVEFGLA